MKAAWVIGGMVLGSFIAGYKQGSDLAAKAKASSVAQ